MADPLSGSAIVLALNFAGRLRMACGSRLFGAPDALEPLSIWSIQASSRSTPFFLASVGNSAEFDEWNSGGLVSNQICPAVTLAQWGVDDLEQVAGTESGGNTFG